MERIAVFPGSFDPFTIGHESVARRALPLFDKIIIAVGQNISKNSFLPIENRLEWMHEIFADEPKIEIQLFKGLTVDFCNKVKAKYILRGLRTAADFEYERAAGQVNKALEKNIESIYILTNPEYSFINSTIVREVIRNGGDAKIFLPHSDKMRDFLKTFKVQ